MDVFIEELNLAFEFNGLYWHCELNKSNNYHVEKTEKCQEKGVRLFHIWEDDWRDKRSILESMIKNLLGKTEKSIYARKCEIKEVDYNESSEFLENNHLQGKSVAKYNIGLFYEGELVSLMTFSKPRLSLGGKNQEGNYELVRFCNKINTNISGSASKLFKYFVDKYNPLKIKSYADKSWSNGKLYEILGFLRLKDSEPSYHYIVDNKRINRFGYRKSVLINQGYDSTKTEHQIMLEREIYRIYDCGCMVFEWNSGKLI